MEKVNAEKLQKWINDYIHDCKIAMNVSSAAQDKLGVANWEGRIRAFRHLLESIEEGAFRSY